MFRLIFKYFLQVPHTTLTLYHPRYVQLTAHFKCSTYCCRFDPWPSLCVIQDHIPVPAAAVPVPLYVLLSHHRVPVADNQHSNQQSQRPDGQSVYTQYDWCRQPHEACQCEFHNEERNYRQRNNKLVASKLIILPQSHYQSTQCTHNISLKRVR